MLIQFGQKFYEIWQKNELYIINKNEKLKKLFKSKFDLK